MFRRLFLVAAIGLAALPAIADTISVVPPNPPTGTLITLQISGTSPVSTPIYLYRFAIVGQTVHIEGCIPPGFEVGSNYEFPVPIGTLGQGVYTVEYYTLDCGPPGSPGNPPGPLNLRASASFSVGNASSTAPIFVTQASNSHIVANLSTMLEQNCLGNATTISPLSPPGYFDLYTNILCTPPSPPALYTYTVDLGTVADGDYTIDWGFIAGGFGPVGGTFSQPFSVRNGVLVSAILITPQPGLWWNPDESGSGYAIDVQHGVVVVTVYSYNQDGTAQWYLVSGPLSNNAVSGPLQKFKSGQCISCTYQAPVANGNNGTMTIVFTSATRASVTLPGGRSFTIATPSY